VSTVTAIFEQAWRAHQAGALPQAEQLYRQVLQVDPGYADAWCFLGAIFQSQGKLAEAEANQRRALKLIPDFATAQKCLGIAVAQQGRLEEAAEIFDAMLRYQTDDAEVYNNQGLVRAQQGRWEEALSNYAQAIALNPDYGDTHWNRALVWLVQGRFEEGWREYEWRWKQPNFTPRHFKQPMWDGTPLHGRTILLYGEQGLGDAIQFIRYARLVQELGGKVIVECHAPLMKLLASVQGIDRLLPFGAALPAFDVQTPLCSLPFLLGTTLANVPAQVPYIVAEQGLVAQWKCELEGVAPSSGSGLRIGIAWQGNPTFRDDRWRSIPLTQFAPLSQVEGVRLISLQKGHGTDQLRGVADLFEVLDFGSRLDEAAGPFMDTAAIMKNVDLVITSDTAVPHLAGALGVPVWVALPHVPDWRWMLQREDSPWYPTMRLFRQARDGDWEGVFAHMAAELKDFA